MKIGWILVTCAIAAEPASAQWGNPYAAWDQLQRSQQAQAAQDQARAMRDQVYIQQQQLDLQREQLEQQRLLYDLQRRQLEQQQVEREQALQYQEQRLTERQRIANSSKVDVTPSNAARRVVPAGVFLNSEVSSSDGTKHCVFNNGYKRTVESTKSCFEE